MRLTEVYPKRVNARIVGKNSHQEIEVTPEMVEAGARLLFDSGFVDYPYEHDGTIQALVRRVLNAALIADKASNKEKMITACPVCILEECTPIMGLLYESISSVRCLLHGVLTTQDVVIRNSDIRLQRKWREAQERFSLQSAACNEGNS